MSNQTQKVKIIKISLEKRINTQILHVNSSHSQP